MNSDVFEASSVELALQKAAEALGVAHEELEYEVLEQTNDDFWGFGDTVVRLRAWPIGQASGGGPDLLPASDEDGSSDTGEEDPVAASAAVLEAAELSQPDPQRSDEAVGAQQLEREEEAPPRDRSEHAEQAIDSDEDLAASLSGLLERLFEAMDFDCSVETDAQEDAMFVRIGGDDSQYLLDGRGRGLGALELILNHAFRHRPAGSARKVRVDAGDFRSQQDEEIRDLAYQVAHQAKESGTVQETRPLNPYERRIVHLTLADDAAVATRSEGTGFLKTVSVVPSRGRRPR